MRDLRRVLTAVALPFGLAACSLDATRPATDIAVPATFTHAKEAASPPITTDWPALFGSPELTRLARGTAANNLDVQAAAARIIEADAQAQVTDAALLPTLTNSNSATQSRTPATRTGSTTAVTSGSYQLGLSASYELDLSKPLIRTNGRTCGQL